MWQITWILGFLPEWFWSMLLILGISAMLAAWVLKFIPFVSTYKLPLNVGGIIAVIISVWFLGAASNEEKWQQKVQELEAKLKVSEEQSKQENIVIKEKIVIKDRIVKERGQKQIEYIDRVIKEKEEIKVFIENCPIPKDIIDEHNKAAAAIKQEAKK